MEVHFNASLKFFRSLMLRLHSQHGGREWTLPSGARLVIEEYPCSDPTLQMMSWDVSTPLEVEGPNRRHAVIQAFSRDKNSTVVLLEDCRIISFGEISPNKVKVLDPDRAIGPPLFDELCQELQHQMDAWAPPPTGKDRDHLSPKTDDGLDPLDRKIIEVVRQIEDEGLKATDELVALRSPLNPKTNEPYHRVTISRRRTSMRNRGYKV